MAERVSQNKSWRTRSRLGDGQAGATR